MITITQNKFNPVDPMPKASEKDKGTMSDTKITKPGIYAVTCKWAGNDTTKTKGTPYYSLLLVSEVHGKIYGRIWTTEKARSGEYMRRICEAFAIPNVPPESADEFADKQCNIVVNINDRGYPEVDAYAPFDPKKETTADTEPATDEDEPIPMPTDEYLASIKPDDMPF